MDILIIILIVLIVLLVLILALTFKMDKNLRKIQELLAKDLESEGTHGRHTSGGSGDTRDDTVVGDVHRPE